MGRGSQNPCRKAAYPKPFTTPISTSVLLVASETPLTVQEFFAYLPHKMIREENTDSGDLIQGTLEMLVLKALARGPLHGYAVAEWIHQTSQQLLKVEEGALYPALHRLELRGLLKAEWGASENNRRAKFYQLTAEGKKKLSAESQRWARLSAAVAFVMQAS
jgi:PadR family transcriptional regulator